MSSPKAPAPFSNDQFKLLRTGIYDCDQTKVFINSDDTFAMLWPTPTMNSEEYQSRLSKKGLKDYKKNMKPMEARFQKLEPYLSANGSFLEIGSADGAFLSLPSVQTAQPLIVFFGNR